MREHLYKAKTLDGEWIEGNLIKYCYGELSNELLKECGIKIFVVENGMKVSFSIKQTAYPFPEFEVIPETVCEFTGLTDKNGKKIFEGDIIKVKNCETFAIKYQFNEFRFIPICNGYTWLQAHEYKEKDFEVIGNIHEGEENVRT